MLPDDAPGTDYAVSASWLRRQLDVVARLGLTVVPLAELAARVLRGASLDGLAAVVFDDALVGVHHHALPELAGRGWPATLHPVTDRLGAEPPWWPGSRRTMTAAELAEAAAAGVNGGCARDHARLPAVPARRPPSPLSSPGRAHSLPT